MLTAAINVDKLPVMAKTLKTTLLRTPGNRYWGWVAHENGRWHFSAHKFGRGDLAREDVRTWETPSVIFAGIEDPVIANVALRVFEAAIEGGADLLKAWDLAIQVPNVRAAIKPGSQDWRAVIQTILERRGWSQTELQTQLRARGFPVSYMTIHCWLHKGKTPRSDEYRRVLMEMAKP